MKLGSNLTKTMSRLTGVRQTRRQRRKAARAAGKDDELTKQIANAQAKGDAELDARLLAEKREGMLREQGSEQQLELGAEVAKLTNTLGEAWLTIDELVKANEAHVTDLECFKESLGGFLTSLETLENRVQLAEDTIGDTNVQVTDLEDRATAHDALLESLNLRLLEVEQSTMLKDDG